MQTEILPELLDTPVGREADTILRSCVHCGFCTATCPTYQLLGDELDGPRGRIYLIKQVVEGQAVTRITQRHLDRCLTCRSCETTCPSGVRYARLAEIGRELVDERVPRSLGERLLRTSLIHTLPYPRRFGALLRLARWARPWLPARWRDKVPPVRPAGARPAPVVGHRRMLALAGCVQSVTTPRTNVAAARILARLGIDLIEVPRAGCCGALAQHLNHPGTAHEAMRRNIDAWWPEIEAGAEAILVTASGCGVQLKEYGERLRDDPDYAQRAARVAALARDPIEVLGSEDLGPLGRPGQGQRVAFHPPCTLQHGQGLRQVVEPLLQGLGYRVAAIQDAHLCCGSAGSYSLTEPRLAERLRENKLAALMMAEPDLIATANIGCQLHLAVGHDKPVVHWLELLDPDEAGKSFSSLGD